MPSSPPPLDMNAMICALRAVNPLPASSKKSRLRMQKLLSTVPQLVTDMDTESQAERMFTLFSELPAELRLKIWKTAARNDPNTICIHLRRQQRNGGLRCGTNFYREGNMFLPAPVRVNNCNGISAVIPGILMASKEARTEALKSYTAWKERADSDHMRTTYINFNIDYFLVSEHLGDPRRLGLERLLTRLNFDDSIFTYIQHAIRRYSPSRCGLFRLASMRREIWSRTSSLDTIYLTNCRSEYEIKKGVDADNEDTPKAVDLEQELADKKDRLVEIDRCRKQYEDSFASAASDAAAGDSSSSSNTTTTTNNNTSSTATKNIDIMWVNCAEVNLVLWKNPYVGVSWS